MPEYNSTSGKKNRATEDEILDAYKMLGEGRRGPYLTDDGLKDAYDLRKNSYEALTKENDEYSQDFGKRMIRDLDKAYALLKAERAQQQKDLMQPMPVEIVKTSPKNVIVIFPRKEAPPAIPQDPGIAYYVTESSSEQVMSSLSELQKKQKTTPPAPKSMATPLYTGSHHAPVPEVTFEKKSWGEGTGVLVKPVKPLQLEQLKGYNGPKGFQGFKEGGFKGVKGLAGFKQVAEIRQGNMQNILTYLRTQNINCQLVSPGDNIEAGPAADKPSKPGFSKQ
jgi:hypothetical protein